MKMPAIVRQTLADAGITGPLRMTPMGGGDTALSARVDSESGCWFVKMHDSAELLRAEQAGLEALAPHLRCPAVMGFGEGPSGAVLLLEYLDMRSLQGGAHWLAAGEALARLHRVECREGFGHHPANFIGGSPQSNRNHADWADFFLHERLLPQWQQARSLPAAVRDRVEQVMARLPDWLPASPRSALVHGDLWQGNLAQVNGEPVFFDPACYHGDPQVDLAMLNLFGRVPAAFYEGYQGREPDRDQQRPWPVYDLYHWLNHFNLFGGHYASAVDNTARQLLADG